MYSYSLLCKFYDQVSLHKEELYFKYLGSSFQRRLRTQRFKNNSLYSLGK